MRMAMIVFGLVFSVPIASFGQGIANRNISGNADKYLIFLEPAKEAVQIYEILGQKQWINSIRKAATMLPNAFLEEVGLQTWRFSIYTETWVTGTPGQINLLPTERPGWMTWEPFIEDGFNEAEMVFVALHEMGHMYDSSGLGFALSSLNTYRFESAGEAFWIWDQKKRKFILESTLRFNKAPDVLEEEAVTLYGRKMGTGEDFADTFALYVLWPEYLKEHFPFHYAATRKILVKEYKSAYPMPSSIKSRLAVK